VQHPERPEYTKQKQKKPELKGKRLIKLQ